MTPARVVIVDDDPLVRGALRLILGGAAALDVVGEAADGLEAVSVVEHTRPDVVLMDLRMPRMDGLTATQRLRQRGSPTRVIALTPSTPTRWS